MELTQTSLMITFTFRLPKPQDWNVPRGVRKHCISREGNVY